jgi:hypothetical protein
VYRGNNQRSPSLSGQVSPRKDLLADITPEMRVDFVSAAHFDGNGISPEGHTILAYAGLTEIRIAGIASAFQTNHNVKKDNTLSAKQSH